MSKFFRYQGRIYEIFEEEGLFPNGCPQFSLCKLGEAGGRQWMPHADHRDLLEIALLGVRVDEHGVPLILHDVVKDLQTALDVACSEGWMWQVRSEHDTTYATHEKRDDGARKLFQLMGKKESDMPNNPGAAIYKRLTKARIKVRWPQTKKV